MSRRWDLTLGLLYLGVLAGAAILSLRGGEVVTPGGHALGGTCVWHALGMSCPFCGMTRSFVAAAHGDLGAAFGFHLAGPVLAAVLAGSVVGMVVLALGGRRPLAVRPGYLRFMEATAMVCLLAGAARWVW